MSPRRSTAARVLALDLDGTLLRDDKTVSDFTIATLRRAQAAGVRVFYVTGRRERIAMPVLHQINVPAYAVLNNGPVAMELPSRTRCVTRYISTPVVLNVITCLRAVNRPPVIVIDPLNAGATVPAASSSAQVSSFKDQESSPVHPATSSPDLVMDRSLLSIRLYDEYAQRHAGFISIADDIAASPLISRAVGMFLCEPTDSIEPLRAHLNAALGELIEHRSLDNLEYIPDHRILEMVEPGLTKWNGVAMLLETLGIDDADVYAFGDDHNDLDMLTGASMSFAPASAVLAAKQAADRVIPSNNDDGVAITIRSLFPDIFD